MNYIDEYRSEMNDANSLLEEEFMGIKLSYILLATLLALVCIGIVTILWKIFSAQRKRRPFHQIDERDQTLSDQSYDDVKPNFLVMQSQDGQYFRVLRESAAAGEVSVAGSSAYGAVGWQIASENEEASSKYMPKFTRPHYPTDATCHDEHESLISYDGKN